MKQLLVDYDEYEVEMKDTYQRGYEMGCSDYESMIFSALNGKFEEIEHELKTNKSQMLSSIYRMLKS